MKIAYVYPSSLSVMSQLGLNLTRSTLLAMAGVSLILCAASPSKAQEGTNKGFDSVRVSQFSQDPDEVTRKHLKRAADDIEAARANKDTNPGAFIEALLRAASVYQGIYESEKADEYFQQALDFFNKLGDGRYKVHVTSMMQYALQYEPPSTAIKTFGTLEEFAERNNSYGFQTLDTELPYEIIVCVKARTFEPGTPDAEIIDVIKKLNKLAWKKVVDVRAAIRGANDESLKVPLSNYAIACEANGDIREAEESLLRVNALERRIVIMHAISDLNLATFYLRQKMFDKFEAAWGEAANLEQGHVSSPVASNFASLIAQCRTDDRAADAQSMLATLLGKGGNYVVKALDPTIETLVDDYIRSGDLDRAEALVKHRLQASTTCTEDIACNDWRLKLSDIYLSMGRKAESDKVFQQVMASFALQSVSTEPYLQRRANLLQRLGMTATGQKTRPTPRKSAGPIKVRFLLFATQEICLGHNITINSYDSSDPKDLSPFGRVDPWRSEGSVCCLGITRFAGNILMCGTLYGKCMPPDVVRRSFGASGAPVPEKLAPIRPALSPPNSNVTDLRKFPRDIATLKPGDYITDHLEGRMLVRREKGRFRFFIVDSGQPQPYAVDFSYLPDTTNNLPPADFQIWYSGLKKVRVDGLLGIVYAPNATVEIPFNGRFAGAIVANRIVGEGNNMFSFDKRLLETEFK